MQSDQLAGLVIDLVGDKDMFRILSSEEKEWKQISKDGRKKQEKLTNYVLNARTALTKLRDLAVRASPSLGVPYKSAAERCLRDLDTLYERVPSPIESRHSRPTENPLSSSVVPLYWFFTEECGLSGNESEVRAAMIRNEFLTPPESAKLKYKAQYSNAESQGCSAVRLAVKRWRPEGAHPSPKQP